MPSALEERSSHNSKEVFKMNQGANYKKISDYLKALFIAQLTNPNELMFPLNRRKEKKKRKTK